MKTFLSRALTLIFVAAAVMTGGARSADPIDRIREADLKADLFTLAGDDMRGREGGTLDEMNASMWIAERARQAGLQPAGDNGTYPSVNVIAKVPGRDPKLKNEYVLHSAHQDHDGVRYDPDTAGLLGAQGPHRNSPELVNMALAANSAVTKFTIDSSWDDPQHREGWYYRSDHLPYARAGVPALFFTTLLHADYHTPMDKPDRIDVKKLTRMTKWMYATGRAVSEAAVAPAADPNFKLERCRDFTGDYCGK